MTCTRNWVTFVYSLFVSPLLNPTIYSFSFVLLLFTLTFYLLLCWNIVLLLHKCNEDFLWMFMVLLWFKKKEVGLMFLPRASSRCSFFFFVLLLTRFGKLLLVDSRIFIFPKDPERRPLTFISVPPSCNHHSCTQE